MATLSSLGKSNTTNRIQNFRNLIPTNSLSRTTKLSACLAAVVTVALGFLAGVSPMLGLACVAGLFLVYILFRLGRDASLIWLLAIPWQFLPGINANPLLNPWLWAACIRLISARRVRGSGTSNIAIAAVIILPASYVISGLFFGIAEPSLMTWLFCYVPLAASLIIVPPDSAVVRRHLFYVGIVMATLVVIEVIFGLSVGQLIQSNLSVQEYLRSGRALGLTGNPLFTSSVLLVAFFVPFKSSTLTMIGRGLIIAAVVLTGSKSAVIGLAVGILLFAVSKGIKRFALTLALVSATLLALQAVAENAFNGVFRRFAVFSDLRSSDPDRAFTTEFVWNWIGLHPAGGTPVGSALIDKRILSPVSGGSRFGIESTWLAMAADTGVILIGVAVILLGLYSIRYRRIGTVQALFALVVSLFFWNGLYGAWVIVPIFLLLALSPVDSPDARSDLPGEPEDALNSKAVSQ